MSSLYLYGTSGHAKVIVDVIISTMPIGNIKGVFDDDESKKEFLTIPFLGKYNNNFSKNKSLIICIGDNFIRKKIVNRVTSNFFKVIHSTAVISKYAFIKKGTVVMANAVVNSEAIIGSHCIINTASIIEHGCIIEDYVHISPNATLAGNVFIGEGTHIGISANIVPGVSIGKWCVIGAGSTVINDIPDYSVVVGSPAKFIRKNMLK